MTSHARFGLTVTLAAAALVGSVNCRPEKEDDRTTDAGEQDGRDAGQGPQGLAADQLEERYVAAFCAASVRCGTPVGTAAALPNVNTCLAYLNTVGLAPDATFDTPRAVEESIAGGKIQYDGVKAEACLAALEQIPCEDLRAKGPNPKDLAACAGVFVGKVAKDGACIADFACVAGHYCSRASEDAKCQGTCQPIDTGRCESHGDCATGKVCVVDYANGNHCAERGGVGATCSSAETCQAGLNCQWGASGGTCQPFPSEGQTCDGACAPGHECRPDRDSGTAKCVKLPGDGDACDSGETMCGPGFWCELTDGTAGHCRALKGEGEACEGQNCQPGLSCLMVDGAATCRRAAKAGESCVDHNHCGAPLSMLWCNPATSKCEVFPGAGQPCLEITVAGMPQSFCNGFEAWCDTEAETPSCKAYKTRGAPCTSGSECGPDLGGECLEGVCYRQQAQACTP